MCRSYLRYRSMPFLALSLHSSCIASVLILLLMALPWSAVAQSSNFTGAQSTLSADDANHRILSRISQMPLSFEPNVGQAGATTRYVVHAGSNTLLLGEDGANFLISRHEPTTRGAKRGILSLSMELLGGNRQAKILALDPQSHDSNYFIGKDASRWQTHVAHYARVQYVSVYPGVDLIYHGNQGRLEYDFQVAPGADPKAIALRFAGIDKLEVDRASGDLILSAGGEELRFLKPVAYQWTSAGISGSAEKQLIAANFVVHGNKASFHLEPYDHHKPLVIDPVITYATYLGGNGLNYTTSIAVDPSGNSYIAGYTNATNFPVTSGANQATYGGSEPAPDGWWHDFGDAFITKFDPTGKLVYSTYLGGSMDDLANGIAVDSSGDVFVTGMTESTNFPTTAGAFQPNFVGYGSSCAVMGSDGFITKLDPTGSILIYSTYLSGSSGASPNAIAIDAAGDAYVTGYTLSHDFPVTAGAFQTNFGTGQGCSCSGNFSAFVAKLNPGGTGLVYATYLGGAIANTIALDTSGNAYVSGNTDGTSFPTTPGAFQPTAPAPGTCGPQNAFATALNANGTSLIYSTYLAGSGGTCGGNGIHVDGGGNAYVLGSTRSTDFPVTAGAFQSSASGGCDVFVAKLNPTGSALIYSTLLGGSGDDTAGGITVDANGNAYVTGQTSSVNFPTLNPTQPTLAGGGEDAFVTALNATGTALMFSTYAGGSGSDNGVGIALDALNNIYVVGDTTSADFPVTPNAFQTIPEGSSDVFVLKVSSVAPTAQSQTITFPNPGQQTYGVAPITLAATASSGLSVSYLVTSTPAGIATVSGSTLTITGTGTMTVSRRATQPRRLKDRRPEPIRSLRR